MGVRGWWVRGETRACSRLICPPTPRTRRPVPDAHKSSSPDSLLTPCRLCGILCAGGDAAGCPQRSRKNESAILLLSCIRRQDHPAICWPYLLACLRHSLSCLPGPRSHAGAAGRASRSELSAAISAFRSKPPPIRRSELPVRPSNTSSGFILRSTLFRRRGLLFRGRRPSPAC